MSEPRSSGNVDLVDWFDEDERVICESCGEGAAVTMAAETTASFCLHCGAISIDGAQINLDGRLTA